MLFTVTYDPLLCGFSIAKKDKETIPPVYEQVYKTGEVFKMVTGAYNIEEACKKFWRKYWLFQNNLFIKKMVRDL